MGARNEAGAGRRAHGAALALLTSLFFTWGLLTSLNDILVPHFKAIFTLNYVQAMLIQLCFFGAYLFCSLPSGYFVERFGYRAGIVSGLLLGAAGCALFLPAASAVSYPLFLVALFVLATGITLLQVAANPCVASLGGEDSAASRLNLTQAFNSLGTTLGPALGSLLILPVASRPGAAAHDIHTVRAPYLVLAALLGVVALVFSQLRLPLSPPKGIGAPEGGESPRILWKQSHLVLGAVAIFLYVGAEVSIGSFLVSWLSSPEIAGLAEHAAGKYLSLYWGLAMLGRFAGAVALRRVRPGRLLAVHASAAIGLILLAIALRGPVAMWAVLLVGLCNSVMFPTIFALSLARLGDRTGEASGALCVSIVGGAVVPVLMGVVADSAGLVASFAVPALCYAYVVHYGLAGHVPREPLVTGGAE